MFNSKMINTYKAVETRWGETRWGEMRRGERRRGVRDEARDMARDKAIDLHVDEKERERERATREIMRARATWRGVPLIGDKSRAGGGVIVL